MTGLPVGRPSVPQVLRTAIEQGELTLQNASIRYIQQVIEFSGCEEPMVVIGIAPPYYPAVCNAYLEKNGSEIIEKVRDIVEGRITRRFL